ncbi:hypothetical protein GCM10012275_42140 [Longimycelium tulufanense]|uniref:HTH cro/C1-type domain-containing protein n=1 Tax=Longimycelium tulufanense TaxID=907463 RepID=A0A8J3FVD1_9PSEU|nr:helix-turn-helix domain-containing protein [Longimycelium tulufanense]GGM67212.1 hypothetical protein GCM10012275_42140 [Longimycelium tulufanense]
MSAPLDPDLPVGKRIQYFRQQEGLSRPVLGGLVGKSAEWVKGIETGRLLPPRLPMLIRIAEVLRVDDLAELTGEQKLSAASFTKERHDSLDKVADALATFPLSAESSEPMSADTLASQVWQAWELWHGSRRQRTAIGVLLPGLLRTAPATVRRMEGAERRRGLRALAEIYHLAQLFLSFQPVPELVHLTGDRAMTAAQDADDPEAIAVTAWYLNHVFRDAGQRHEARVELATRAAGTLRPETGPEHLVRWGLLHLAIALSHAKLGREGDAWHHWDKASKAARTLGDGYAHPYLIFGPGMVDAYAITINADLMKGGEAVRQADRIDLATMPSATRRSFHMIETARGYHLRGEHLATLRMLTKAHEESPDTVRFNLFARPVVADLAAKGGSTVRADAAELAMKIQVPV